MTFRYLGFRCDICAKGGNGDFEAVRKDLGKLCHDFMTSQDLEGIERGNGRSYVLWFRQVLPQRELEAIFKAYPELTFEMSFVGMGTDFFGKVLWQNGIEKRRTIGTMPEERLESTTPPPYEFSMYKPQDDSFLASW